MQCVRVDRERNNGSAAARQPRRVTTGAAGWLVVLLGLLPVCGCGPDGADRPKGLEQVWGEQGRAPGQLEKPRAIAIDDDDQLYIVDMTGRIQVFTTDGEFLRGWRTPEIANGKPCGLSLDRQGHLLVADTHYFRVLFYTTEGRWLEDRTLGGVCGQAPGQFQFVTDAVQDSRGCYYVSEYGDLDRVQKFSREGRFLLQWGGRGSGPGQFIRPQGLAVDERDRVWVADACNHRIQVFDATGREARLVRMWGEQGEAPGQLRYPYDLVLGKKGDVYVCEFGNHRVQKFTRDGRSLGCWGKGGRRAGELTQPWGIAQDSKGRIHVLDTYNHRVQRIRL